MGRTWRSSDRRVVPVGRCYATGKHGFLSRWQAIQVRRTMERDEKAVTELQEFRCRVCGYWHLGNLKEKKNDR